MKGHVYQIMCEAHPIYQQLKLQETSCSSPDDTENMLWLSTECMEKEDTLILILWPLETLGSFTVSTFLTYRNWTQKIGVILNY